jgi:hypothetical protein
LVLFNFQHDDDGAVSGTFLVENGNCAEHPLGIPVSGIVENFQGGHIGLWMQIAWTTPLNRSNITLNVTKHDVVSVCDVLSYDVFQGQENASLDDFFFFLDGERFYLLQTSCRFGV